VNDPARPVDGDELRLLEEDVEHDIHSSWDRDYKADALALSVYFGERCGVRGGLLADRLLDLYHRRGVLMSVLLRGAYGFGAKHRLRTDRLLSLSEDLPVVAMALDRSERIRDLVAEVSALVPRGLVTVERTNLFDGQPPAIRNGTDALKLSVFVGRHERADGRAAFATVCETLYEQGVSGATVLLGVDGTRHGQRERARFFARNTTVPAMVIAVGERQSVLLGMEQLRASVPDALLALQAVRVCKRDGRLLAHPASVAHGGAPLQKLTVVVSEATKHAGRPVHSELVRRLRHARLAGATALRGIWGFHGSHPPHGDRLLALRRHSPVLVVAIDTPARIAQAFPLIDELTRERGLVTSEPLPANIALSARL
jgi:PII-like signaling protein